VSSTKWAKRVLRYNAIGIKKTRKTPNGITIVQGIMYYKPEIMTDHKRTVLVCDNDEKVLSSIRTGLAEHNFDVQVMTSPDELVENAEQHHVDAVIVNPDLPGFNPYDTCKYLKKTFGIPVLLLVDPHSTARAVLDGCSADDVLTKPVKIEDLATLMSKHMTLSRS
jgi:DNA-binding response OmpR family regulator